MRTSDFMFRKLLTYLLCYLLSLYNDSTMVTDCLLQRLRFIDLLSMSWRLNTKFRSSLVTTVTILLHRVTYRSRPIGRLLNLLSTEYLALAMFRHLGDFWCVQWLQRPRPMGIDINISQWIWRHDKKWIINTAFHIVDSSTPPFPEWLDWTVAESSLVLQSFVYRLLLG